MSRVVYSILPYTLSSRPHHDTNLLLTVLVSLASHSKELRASISVLSSTDLSWSSWSRHFRRTVMRVAHYTCLRTRAFTIWMLTRPFDNCAGHYLVHLRRAPTSPCSLLEVIRRPRQRHTSRRLCHLHEDPPRATLSFSPVPLTNLHSQSHITQPERSRGQPCAVCGPLRGAP